MALKIVRKEEPITVDQLVIVLYGQPGIGKSTLAFTANTPLLLDFDRGAYRAANRGDTVQVDSWQDVTAISAEDLAAYNTVVVDTAGRALDFLSDDIIRRDPKKGRGGALSLQGYGALKSEFYAWLKMLRLLGKDIVLIAHGSEEKKGDDILERLDVQGGSKQEIYKRAYAMGRLSVANGKRILTFSPTDTAFGKNPGQLPAMEVPEIGIAPQFLAGIIAQIKAKLNTMTEEQGKRVAAITEWTERIDLAKSADDFNTLVDVVKTADTAIQQVIKGALHQRATAAGLTFKKGNGYVAKEAA